MLTAEQIRVFTISYGDENHLREHHRAVIDYETYPLITSLLADIWQMHRTPAISEKRDQLKVRIERACADANAVHALLDLADRWWVRERFDPEYERPWWAFWRVFG